MLTVQKCDEQLASIRADATAERAKGKEKDDLKYNRLKRESDKWDAARKFLLNNPAQEYLEGEIARLETILSHIESDFEEWNRYQKTSKTLEERKAEYNSIKETAKHRRHLKNAKFILHG